MSDKETAGQRERTNKSKGIPLDERIVIVEKALSDMSIAPTPENEAILAKWLIDNGYEPMMFAAACRIIQSRYRS